MVKKVLKLSFEVIKRRFLNREDVKIIAIDAGCSKTTIYRLMDVNGIIRTRRYSKRLTHHNMIYSIKPLPQYKNGELI